jgi:hypothetical protein
VIHPGARRVAILGLGTGVTAATAGLFEGVRSIDIVELEPSVAEVARFFERENGGILSDPRTRLRIDDGRSHFGSRRGEYDVVISEPSNPWISGVANLYTVESFREIRESLAPGGVFGLWVQLHGISLDAYRLIARTALAVFPDATLWQVSPGDTLIICGKGGEGERDVAALGARLRGNPRLSAALGERGEVPLEPLVTSYLLGTPELRRFAGPGDLNTDDRNILEFTAPRSVYRQELNRILREVVRWKEPRLPPFLRLPETDTVAFHLRTGEMHNLEGNVALALWEFRMAPSLAPRQAAGGEGGPGKVPAAGAAEDFEGPTAWHFLPIAGTERPEDGDEEASLDWQADIAHLTRTSGVVRGSGRGGGHGLSLKGARISPGGYAVPLESDPSAEYEVGCWLKYDTGENGSAGIAVSEYNTVGGSGIQPTAAFERRHLVRRTIPFHRKGKQEWAPVSFRFRTSPGTVMVSVLFFIDADRDGRAFFDDIRVARVGPP